MQTDTPIDPSNPPPMPGLTALARHAGRPLVIFDLETTDLVGRTDFGIVEIGCWRINLDGSQHFFQELVNPENPFSLKIQELTGIREEEVLDKLPFSRWATLMSNIFTQCLVAGFNSRSFDIPGVCSQLLRYGRELPPVGEQLDVRDLWVGFHNPKNGRGKLTEVAEHYECAFDGAHRAMADVKGTGNILEAMIGKHGLDKILPYLTPTHENGGCAAQPAPLRARTALSNANSRPSFWKQRANDHENGVYQDAILKSLAELGRWDESHAMLVCDKPDSMAISMAMAELLNSGRVHPQTVAIESAQLWLQTNWVQLKANSPEGKLKPMLTFAKQSGAPAELDYTQLRVALRLEALANNPELAREARSVMEANALLQAQAAPTPIPNDSATPRSSVFKR